MANTPTKANTNDKKPREAELSHSMVHYLLAIHKLKEDKGYARVTDIAKDLGLTKGSVSTALNNLKKRNLVKEEDDTKFLLLTDDGHDEVHKTLTSRTLLYYFLKDFVGVSEAVAEKDSCMIEHLLSEETSTKFFEFMKTLSCSCDDLAKSGKLPKGFNFQTTLSLCDYKSAEEFMEGQKGDTYLQEEKDA
ncbi:metal-dependent transcriptional regulator [Halobacteriovorax sp. GFR7]|uniref:metal-dependent transcriptional regulator n=1 Tax=unclassified Halobacteriovorax TaxID=2639665 RepID=UPI003D9896FF